jgi:hypothetical protein
MGSLIRGLAISQAGLLERFFSTILQILRRDEAVAQGVFADRARFEELEQVVRAASLARPLGVSTSVASVS